MIIPIRCFTCNNVIAGKWLPYVDSVENHRKESGKTDMEYLTDSTTRTAEAKALDDVKVPKSKPCCRRHFLGHVDLM